MPEYNKFKRCTGLSQKAGKKYVSISFTRVGLFSWGHRRVLGSSSLELP